MKSSSKQLPSCVKSRQYFFGYTQIGIDYVPINHNPIFPFYLCYQGCQCVSSSLSHVIRLRSLLQLFLTVSVPSLNDGLCMVVAKFNHAISHSSSTSVIIQVPIERYLFTLTFFAYPLQKNVAFLDASYYIRSFFSFGVLRKLTEGLGDPCSPQWH